MPNAYANKVQVTRGGQTETLIDLTADTAIASDVAQGKYFHLASGERVVGTATGGGGGGGASNVVYGNFTTNASEGAQTINIPYSGSGYPIMVSVFYSDGSVNHTSVYGVSLYTATKSFATVAPTFTGDANADRYSFMTVYRTNNNSYSGQVNYSGFSAIANDVDASGTYSSFTLKLTSNSTLSVYVQGESYGLLPSAEYKCVVAYSE